VRDHPAAQPHRHLVGQVPRAVSMRGLLARMHWLRGESDQAAQLAQEVLGLAEGEHPFALSQALATVAVPIALWRGERARAQFLNDRLLAQADRHRQPKWQSWANNYRFVLRLGAGGPDRQALLQGWARPHNPMELDIIGTFDEDLVSPAVLQRVDDGTVGWCAAEVLRAHARVELRRDPTGAAARAEALLQRSLHVARAQEALAWELRTATSLAGLWQAQGHGARARALLEPVLERCVEGQGTLDVVTARAQLGAA